MQSTRSTAPATDSQAADLADLTWSGRLSLRQRILAVNIFAILLLAGSFFYLDSYRKRLIDERVAQALQQANVVAAALDRLPAEGQAPYLGQVGAQTRTRFRIARGLSLTVDSWAVGRPSFTVRDPANEPWQRHAARLLDDIIETIVDAGDPVMFTGFAPPERWPRSGAGWKLARDRTHMIWASTRVGGSDILLSETNARDIRRLVRAERERLGIVIAVISALSILLSLFLARTIEKPLRALAKAAQRVRFGRDREVNVPRLPRRRDEIGLLARALSDMTHALHQRIDATEAFAADVAHELKNPLASLSSAAQGLRTVKQPELRAQLEDIIAEDVVRLDRLITDISELSRLDARLARTRFEDVDISALVTEIVRAREARHFDDGIGVVVEPPADAVTVRGDAAQLTRVIDNLIANAVSFSPPGTVVRTSVKRDGDDVMIMVEDSGPGIPETAREAIFERFHSDRPVGESFGTHSGLGLSIARAIVEGHDGSISASSREDADGARFVVRLPAAQ